VAEQHRGVPVKCGRCGRTFTTRAEACAPPVRLDIGAASTVGVHTELEGRFLTQHLVFWNLDQRHELAVLLIAASRGLDAAAAVLAPVLAGFLNGASQDAAGAAQIITAACKERCAIAVIWDGQAAIGGECPIYQMSAGRLTRLRRGPVKLAAGDWLILAGDSVHPLLDESMLQRELTSAPATAVALADHLRQLAGRGGDTILVVRGY
jgi:hypothetical protein